MKPVIHLNSKKSKKNNVQKGGKWGGTFIL
jgi:hypothetical protein